jgi:hypothetical protein
MLHAGHRSNALEQIPNERLSPSAVEQNSVGQHDRCLEAAA